MYVYIIYIIYTFIDHLAVHITVIILVVVWTRVQEKITPILHANKLCVCQNIALSDHRDSIKNYPEVAKLVLPIQEILQNYYSMESREGTKNFKTSSDCLIIQCFNLDYFLVEFQGKLWF